MEQRQGTVHRILVGSPIHQKPEILLEFLDSLLQLRQDTVSLDFMFIDDNTNAKSSELLRSFQSNASGQVFIEPGAQKDEYITDGQTHQWTKNLIEKVGEFKDHIIRTAIEAEYDYLFLVDSDLLLHPRTIEHLVGTEKDIISEIFWTRWEPNEPELPQVWLKDHYTLYDQGSTEVLTKEEATRRMVAFLEQLRVPGLYEIGGLGACTLLSRKALLGGNKFAPIRNLTMNGEDRYFCVRAAVLGFPLHVDTHYPAFHIYRSSDLARIPAYKRENFSRELENEKLVVSHVIKRAMSALGTFNYSFGYPEAWQGHFTDALRDTLMKQVLDDLEQNVDNQLVSQADVPVVQVLNLEENKAYVQFVLVSQGVENNIPFQDKNQFEALLLKNQHGSWQIDQYAPVAL